MKRTVAIPAKHEGKSQQELNALGFGDFELTPQEATELLEEQAVATAEQEDKNLLAARKAALASKWVDPFDLIDDILERGMEAVQEDRNAIKAANPKPE